MLRLPGESRLWDALSEGKWLYRGVPRESSEVIDVQAISEVRPPRPERVGETWRDYHVHGNTETGYTSWTTDRNIAEDAGRFSSEAPGLSGQVVIFRVALDSVPQTRIFAGLAAQAWCFAGK